MLELFLKGGPLMWPLLLTSILTVSVIIERGFYWGTLAFYRKPKDTLTFLELVEKKEFEEALTLGRETLDPILQVLYQGLYKKEQGVSAVLAKAAKEKMQALSRGCSTLDTMITLAPLLGLLGTVTGMIKSFALLGGTALDSPAVITGGIAEALLATAFGLFVAILALIPFNFFNKQIESLRIEIESAATLLESLLTEK